MSTRPADQRLPGPEQHTEEAAPAIERPVISPASEWPKLPAAADAAGPDGAAGPTEPDGPAEANGTSEADATADADRPARPASVRIRKKRTESRASRVKRITRRVGVVLLTTCLLVGLALVAVLIFAPHELF